MTQYHVIDRLIHKPVKLSVDQPADLQPGSLLVYKDDEGKEMVGEYLGYSTTTEKAGTFLYPLVGEQSTLFHGYQEKAKELYEIFVKEFCSQFTEAIPITSRMNLQGNQVYFYFYAETRFNFSEFVKSFRSLIGYKFFLYQIGSRDRVRLHPNKHEWFDASGLPLMYSIFRHPLPTVDSETIAIQNLEGRNPERLKDWSGKLDHTLNFEKDVYKQETGKYPRRGDIIDFHGKAMKCMGYNILTQEIKLREYTKKDSLENLGERTTISLDEYTLSQKTTTPSK